jgi:hypothetical protein
MFHKVLKTNELTVERERNPQTVGPKEKLHLVRKIPPNVGAKE